MKHIEALIKLSEHVFGLEPGGLCYDEPDDEPVGAFSDGRPLPMTYGHVRRARAEYDILMGEIK